MTLDEDLQNTVRILIGQSTALHARLEADDVPSDLKAMIREYDFTLRTLLTAIVGATQLHGWQIRDLQTDHAALQLRIKNLEEKQS